MILDSRAGGPSSVTRVLMRHTETDEHRGREVGGRGRKDVALSPEAPGAPEAGGGPVSPPCPPRLRTQYLPAPRGSALCVPFPLEDLGHRVLGLAPGNRCAARGEPRSLP